MTTGADRRVRTPGFGERELGWRRATPGSTPLYQPFVLELQWCDEPARGAAAGEDLLRLTRDRDELMKRFDQVFARP
jgi:hypothetical protein